MHLPLQELFAAPTIAGLAGRGGAPADDEPITPRPRAAGAAASAAQRRMWFLDQLDPGSPLYVLPIAWRVRGPLDVRASAAPEIDEIVRRHEALRTTFRPRDGVPVPAVREPADCPLTVTDLSAADDPGARDGERLVRFGETGIALTGTPLIRAELLRLAEDEHVLAVAIHHIAADGWSLDVLLDELTALYEAHAAGRPSPPPRPPVQYSDYAAWQRDVLTPAAMARHVEYWRGVLDGAPKSIDLPADRTRPARPSNAGDLVDVVIGAAAADRLRALGRAATRPRSRCWPRCTARCCTG